MRVIGLVDVDIPSVGGKILIHMELPVTISMITLLSCSTCIYSFLEIWYAPFYLWNMSIFGNSVGFDFSYFIPSCSGLDSLSEFQSVIQKPLWEYVFLILFIISSITSCIVLDIHSAVMNLRLLDIFNTSMKLLNKMMSMYRDMFMYLSFIRDGISTLVTKATSDYYLVVQIWVQRYL